ASVSCLYGIGNPTEFHKNIVEIEIGQTIARTKLLQKFVSSLYSRTEADFQRGNFRVKGDTIDLFPAYSDQAVRIHFFGDEIEEIETFDPANGRRINSLDKINIYPANLFVTSQDTLNGAIRNSQIDL